jgi:hypothetical protein
MPSSRRFPVGLMTGRLGNVHGKSNGKSKTPSRFRGGRAFLIPRILARVRKISCHNKYSPRQSGAGPPSIKTCRQFAAIATTCARGQLQLPLPIRGRFEFVGAPARISDLCVGFVLSRRSLAKADSNFGFRASDFGILSDRGIRNSEFGFPPVTQPPLNQRPNTS